MIKEVSSRWLGLIARMKQEANSILRSNRNDGVCIITVHVMVDSNSRPLVWVVPQGKRIEPSKDAGEILLSLVKEL